MKAGERSYFPHLTQNYALRARGEAYSDQDEPEETLQKTRANEHASRLEQNGMLDDDQRAIVVKAESAGFEAGNMARISIDDVEVKCLPNENGNDRGLHLVVINPHNGKVIMA